MDEINAFFDLSKDFKRVAAPRGLVSGRTPAADVNIYKRPKKRLLENEDYAREAREEQERNLSTFGLRQNDDVEDPMDTMDALSDIEECAPSIFERDAVFDTYKINFNRNESLPIYKFRENIISKIRENPVIILEGQTGCGKTTQVPQYILDDCYRRNEYCNMVITQPRRIAARSIAKRVSDERDWELGTIVGYQVGLHRTASDHTRMLYCTTGVLLQKLTKAKTLRPYTHIILDEVHERDQDMDFLLILVRRLLSTNSQNTKIILMSATINTSEFSNYFKIRNNPAPVVTTDSQRAYPVREYYLEDIKPINHQGATVDYENPTIEGDMYSLAAKLIIVMDNIEKHETEASGNKVSSSQNSILIFLPGINEIESMSRRIDGIKLNNTEDETKLTVIRLHSLIPPEEQMRIFQRQPPGCRKVILATNIAESSITVPDVKYVIDFCLTKSSKTDSSTNFTSLQLHWASKANCRQRAGRAGRVMSGRVYRLVPRLFYEEAMSEFGVPEMLRSPLHTLVLKAKMLNMGSPTKILGLAISPPNLTNIKNTILTLKELGAFYTYMNNKSYTPEDGELTFMGRIMASLPLDVTLTRLIVMGYIFSVLNETIIMAAGLSVRSIFTLIPDRNKRDAVLFNKKLQMADGSGSDLFAIWRAYVTWIRMRRTDNFTAADEKNWACALCLNIRQLREMHLLVEEIKQRLNYFNIKVNDPSSVRWLDREKPMVLKIVISAAFYPNYFTRSNLSKDDLQRSISHKLCNNDPCRTIYFTGLNPRTLGHLYVQPIKEYFALAKIDTRNIQVRFQTGSEHVFVTFNADLEENTNDNSDRLIVPGRVCPEVYKAVRLRHSRLPLNLRVMDPKTALQYVREHNLGQFDKDGIWRPNAKMFSTSSMPIMPSIFENKIKGQICHVVNCSKFYFQPFHQAVYLRGISTDLNSENAQRLRFRNPAEISKGMLLAAPLDRIYHRAKVLHVFSSQRRQVEFKVFFIDFGKMHLVPFEQLRKFPEEDIYLQHSGARCFECRLAMIEPSFIKSSNGYWTDEANLELMKVADEGVIEIEVYSLVNSIANVLLKYNNTTLNQILIQKGFAQSTEENYYSKVDHDERDRTQKSMRCFADDERKHIEKNYMEKQVPPEIEEIPRPHLDLCLKTNTLRGPFSPLETSIYSATKIGSWKNVRIEQESVNFPMLDTDPQSAHERLIVAANLTENTNNGDIIARSTTLMPNMHGFSALMVLMFCPRMQIKRNKDKTKFISILAGLGYDAETFEPLFEEHDILLNLDVDILPDDIEQINHLRYSMDTLLLTNPGEEMPPLTQQVRADLHTKIKNLLIKLLSKNRKYIETHMESEHVWQQLSKQDLLEQDNFLGTRALFPMHSSFRLYDENHRTVNVLNEHCRELHAMGKNSDTIQNTTCMLCNIPLESVLQLRIHLLSQLHRDREQQIAFKG